MSVDLEKMLRWTPRVLGLLYAGFLSLFAMDVFGEGLPPLERIQALLTHLIPAGLILVVLAISWRWGWAAGILFLALGVWYVTTAWGRFPLSTYVVIAGPLILLGVLFEIEWWLAWSRARGHD
jgi:hypothetical protein